MREVCHRARGLAAWLGCAGMLALGLPSSARAESEPCPCSTSNQSVVSEVPCLVIRAAFGCEASTVRNACDETVTLVDWPLSSCPDSVCSQELPPNGEAGFHFTRGENNTEGFFENAYTVRADGSEQQLAVSAEVTCDAVSLPLPAKKGCSAAPGALAASGVVLLVGTLARRRPPRATPLA